MPKLIVIRGPTGVGKTTIGNALYRETGWRVPTKVGRN